MIKKYRIVLCRTADNRGKAVVHEVGLDPYLEPGDEILSIYTGLEFKEEDLDGKRIEDMDIFSQAQERAEQRVAEIARLRIRPICIINVIS